MLGIIISLFTIFLYTALGTYVLTKNPHDRTNKIFAILMLVFIIWSVGTYNVGIAANNIPLNEAILYIKIQLSSAIIALAVLVFFALSFTKSERIFKNPLIYLTILPSAYLLYLIWFSDVRGLPLNIFSAIPGAKEEFFLFSAIFAVAGIFLLLKYYNTSKYKEHEQAKLILIGVIAAILAAIIANIVLPMFFGIYDLQLSTIGPAVMGIFFAYTVYQYGLFIRPMPELSPTSFCGTSCTLCNEYLNDNCMGCRFDKDRYTNCEIYSCLREKGYSDCGDCPEIITCIKRNKKHKICYESKPKYNLKKGSTYFAKGNDLSFDIFKDAVSCSAFGLIASTVPPQQIKETYGLTTTPIVWISDEFIEMGVRPNNLGRLGIILVNFMKKINNGVILLDGVDTLLAMNDLNNVLGFVQILNTTARITGSRVIISTSLEGEDLNRMKVGMEYIEG